MFFSFKEFLPPAYRKHKKQIEKEVCKEYGKLIGMDTVSAQHRYVQLCRSLKTYGITFFSIKVSVINTHILCILFRYLNKFVRLAEKGKEKTGAHVVGCNSICHPNGRTRDKGNLVISFFAV